MVRLVCSQCQAARPVLAQEEAVCCGQPMQRAPLLPEANVRETIDNGFMGRRVDAPAEATRLRQQRNSPLPIK